MKAVSPIGLKVDTDQVVLMKRNVCGATYAALSLIFTIYLINR